MIKRNLQNKTLEFGDALTLLPCYGVSTDVNINFVPGFFNIGFNPIKSNEKMPDYCPDSRTMAETIEGISIGFSKAQEKKEATWKKK
jgi:hypothetical protein